MSAPITRRYSECRACCGVIVTVTISGSMDPTKEIVILECRSCGNRRGSYERKKKAPAADGSAAARPVKGT